MADLLSYEEWIELEDRAREISKNFDCDIRIFITDDMREYGVTDIEELTNLLFVKYDIGYGSQRSLLILVMDMSDRNYELRAWGY